MDADALSLETGGELAPVLSAIAGNARKKSAAVFSPAVRKSALLDAAATVGASARGAIESSPAMPKAAAQPGAKTDRAGTKLTQAQLDARAQQRTEDDDLIREAQRGDRSAFDSLVRRYDQSVLRLALHMLGNEQDAQDVHQEAFLKAYRHIGNFRFECSFYTWLYRIVTNLCLDQLRRRKSRREDPATVTDSHGDEMDLLSNISDTRAMANPARELDRKRMGQSINQALSKLTPRERTVFELKHYQGLKLRTIGEMLSTTEETAKNTLFRATRKLRLNLAELREGKA
jgi:RNA polymerase sigma-70 factor (ECF subfamily)